ncbi:chaperone protein DnaJ [Impatiens glandulifera]|uniref:chaperone protein DnaJ n=1 Tax=Impatiens glandulifera TaxID=253017 RepID=UPI001FB14BF1|nr:chaperone protein DnaJ [Impatiens glandulifera]
MQMIVVDHSYANLTTTLSKSKLKPPHAFSTPNPRLFFPTHGTTNLSLGFNHLNNFSAFSPLHKQRKQRVTTVARASSSDYYSILNVTRDATLKEIKSAYRLLARKYHPDLSKRPDAEEKFKELSAAYEVLSDDEKRSTYDRFGVEGLQGNYEGSNAGPRGVDPLDVFGSFFGNLDGHFGEGDGPDDINFTFRNPRSQDLDIRYDLFLSFKESVFGTKKDIEVSNFETCERCDGTGARYSSCIKTCASCKGRGGVVTSQKTPFGVMSQVSTCTTCGGEGKIITDHCQECSGHGRVKSKRSINVSIPPGVNDGATMKLRGEGNFDNKRSITGNLYLVLHVNPKEGIWREGNHLYSQVNVDFTEAILGADVKVETVDGLWDLHVPSGVQHGDTLKIPGLGVPDINRPSRRGDHRFVVKVHIPKEISDTERELVEKLASFRLSRNQGSDLLSGNGRNNPGKQKNRFIMQKIRNSFSNLFGRQSERFSSITLSNPVCVNHRHRMSTSYIFIAFVLTVACIVKNKVDYYLLIQKQEKKCKIDQQIV